LEELKHIVKRHGLILEFERPLLSLASIAIARTRLRKGSFADDGAGFPGRGW
jgi:hypothetical protein